ncbi:ABC transporter substrate-binding protein [Priestia flexa]|jgi:iron complex transport system substrate-binding protein|uniref:ABC transporter substrate-binding protein n=1 Tax=Priestia flexa TaxID=86664 RepID=A0A8I1SQ05_9BACI|nr:ABC transporter substrate-binding protein [Priestia flexa]AQX55168.1 iron ABC transporter substrate-binding protein [Priestia flexa]MBN8253308.1 ABC transporter substrate-binding protein [Priestia flexa]MBN8435732.1 ABC transporter substrate-binding protein [Priestia flexa]MBY6087594.1 ABC transporter substrate-binding protein [Priestia flexa]MCA0968287.1 ABC transporter substrate-binding protein [Priestia flexa]
MKKWLSSVIVAMFLVVLAACGATDEGSKQTEQTKQSEEQAVTVKDARGEEVTVEQAPKKIVSLMPSNTEIVYELGLEKELIGVTSNDDYPASVKEKEQVGDMNINAEKVIALNPDLVLAHGSSMGMSDEVFKQIESAGIPLFVVNDATDFNTVYETIGNIGKLTNKTDEADKTVKEMKAAVSEIEEKAKEIKDEDRKKVWVEVSPAPEIYTTGKGTFMDEMIKIIGAENVAGNEEGWVKLSEEKVVELNPDTIVTTYDGDANEIKNRPAWSDITAVKENQIVNVDSNKTNRPGPRIVEGLEEFAKAVYPEVYN